MSAKSAMLAMRRPISRRRAHFMPTSGDLSRCQQMTAWPISRPRARESIMLCGCAMPKPTGSTSSRWPPPTAPMSMRCTPRLAETGAKIIHAPQDLASPGGGYGFRFFSPDGLTFEISSDVASRHRQPGRALGRGAGQDQPHRAAFARPQGADPVVHRCARLQAFRLAGRFHELPALQFGAPPHCHSAGAAVPQPRRL